MADSQSREPWHLDRRVPIALILTVLVHIAAGAWFWATLQSRVDVLTRDLERQRLADAAHTAAIRRIETSAAGLDQQLAHITDLLERLDRRLERMEERE